MRLLLLLIAACVGAYFTVPTREAHETAARAFQADASTQTEEVQRQTGVSLDSVVDFFTGMLAGQGRYDTYYLASKFTVDMPNAAYLECWGAFTLVQCRKVDRGAAQG